MVAPKQLGPFHIAFAFSPEGFPLAGHFASIKRGPVLILGHGAAPTPGPSPNAGGGEPRLLARLLVRLLSPPLKSGEGPGVGAASGAGSANYDRTPIKRPTAHLPVLATA